MNFDLILNTAKKSKWINTCEMIVLHHTWWWSFKWNMDFLANNPKPASCHYVVWQNGEIWKIGEDHDILWHAWQSQYWIKKDLNNYSIWIEIVNNWENFSEIQKQKVNELVLFLIEKYKIEKNNLVRHKDICVPAWRKVDPYDTLWNDKFKTFEDYKNYLFTKKEIMWEFAKLQWYKLFDKKEYDKPATIWDVKDLLEIALLRFDEKKNNGTLEKR